MECKLTPFPTSSEFSAELIDTLWNVNYEVRSSDNSEVLN